MQEILVMRCMKKYVWLAFFFVEFFLREDARLLLKCCLHQSWGITILRRQLIGLL